MFMFTIKAEDDLYKEFFDKHHKKCSITKTKVIINHGAIGTSIKVKCPKCKKTKDITDYKCW